jgi:hypothetical protein
MNKQHDTGAHHPRWLFTALPGAVFIVFSWLTYGVVRRISGASGKIGLFRYGDFYEFYAGAEALLKGANIYDAGRLGYIYPPLLAFLLAPLSLLPIGQAAWVWLEIKTVLLAACCWLGAEEIQRRLSQPRDLISIMLVYLIGMLINIDKLRTEMNMQQSNLLLLLCFIVALRSLDRRPILSGLALGFGANIKYLTLIALPYLLLRKRYRAAAATVAGTLFWALLPAVIIGWNRNMDLLHRAFLGLVNLSVEKSSAAGAAKVMGPAAGTSITSFSVRYFGNNQETWESIVVVCAVALLYSYFSLKIYRAAKISLFRGRGGQIETEGIYPGVVGLEWAGLIILALAFGPQTNSPHLSMLLFPSIIAVAVLLMPRGQVSGLPLIMGLLIMFFGLVLPPRTPMLEGALRVWMRLSGPLWCVLIMYLTLLQTGLGRLKAQSCKGQP